MNFSKAPTKHLIPVASSFLSDFLPRSIVKRYFPRHVAAAPTRIARFHLKNIYIVPTLAGLGLLGIVLLTLIAAINFQNSMIYMVCFWLASLLVINILYTFRNLSGLRLELLGTEPCFAGQNCLVRLSANSEQSKSAIFVGWKAHDLALVDLGNADACEVNISYPAPRRGFLRPSRIDVFTRYPTGLTIAWAYARLDINAIVYPTPVLMDAISKTEHGQQDAEDGRALGGGVNDFSGMQTYQAGDRLQRVHWAKFAQTRKLYTKNFVDYQSHDLWLDWALLTAGSIEQRLSHLCARILALHTERQSYGLRIPGSLIKPGNSEPHRNKCLSALALFSIEQ
jgi:uncharacterized protein (DUF58 family)